MEWNAKHGTLWNWDSMLTCNNAKAAENRNKVQPTTDQLAIEKDQGINIRSVSSAPDGRGSDGSISDLGYDSSSWSTKSASLNSSSIGESKTPSFTLDGFEASPEDSTNKRELAKTEPLLSLKLGKQIYFEEICGGNSSKTMSSMMPLSPINSAGKRCKSSYQTTLVPCCQVEGCNLDLSSAKDYHRKHRVCVNHSKSPKVVIGGLERRFCQQCSRFHGLSEFDERKRSCRRRLSDHNARRRKPQPKAVCLNPGRLSSFAYDFNQPMSLLWDRVPPVDTNAGPAVTLTWDETSGSKYVQTKKYSIEPEMAGGNHGMNLPRDGIARAITMLNPDSSKLLPSKRIGAEVLNSGFEEYMIAPNEEDSLQDLHRALSLLSTDSSSWDAYETKRVSLDHGTSNHTSSFQRSIAPSPPHASSIHGFPLASEFWVDEQKASFQSRLHTPHDLCHRMG